MDNFIQLFIFILSFVSTPISTAVIDPNQKLCSAHEFLCDDGSCASIPSLCSSRSRWRNKRQTRSKCPNDQWQCDDGTCVSSDVLRDGTNDCPDGTDEISYICHSASEFQCKDSTCISIDRKCDNVRDCSDGSDELNPDCGVELAVQFTRDERYKEPIQKIHTSSGVCELPPYPAHGSYTVHSIPTARPGLVLKRAILLMSCDPGYEPSKAGDVICYDGVWSGRLPDCVLTAELCVLPPFPAHASYVMVNNPTAAPRQAFDSVELNITCDPGYDSGGQTSQKVVCHNGRWSGEINDCMLTIGACKLPPYPAHGAYEVSSAPDAAPGQTFVSVALTITCDPGYGILGDKGRNCYDGKWSANMTDCVATCHLEKDPSVQYRCLQPYRECGLDEPEGTIVSPVCKQNYFFPGEFNQMRCVDGNWNYIARCVPESTGACILPPFPANGSYDVSGVPNFAPGQALETVALTIICDPGYDIAGGKDRTCYSGIWSGEIPDCVPKSDLCILPSYPVHGWYTVPSGVGNPGDAFDVVAIEYKCDLGYNISGSNKFVCNNGKWSGKLEDCTRVAPLPVAPTPGPVFIPEAINNTRRPGLTGYCRLEKDPSVNYLCLLSPASTATRVCRELEPINTIVRPECKVPNYYFPGELNHMRCFDDKWNYVARCVPECGLVTPKGTELVIGGRDVERGELPWHAGVYQKAENYRKQICGGSLVNPRLVISAGHCFIDAQSRKLPASHYSVALGKIYRKWDHELDDGVQKSELADIKTPSHFTGGLSNFQEDLALLFLVETIVYQNHIRPICVDYNPEIEKQQLRNGQLGKVAGWGLTTPNANYAEVLQVVELPFVPIEECQADAPPEFREYITGDKICAGYRNGTAVCRGDSGGGLAFPRADQGKTRYYLRGIVSTAPQALDGVICNAFWMTTFTQVSRHERFIKDHVNI